MYSYLFTMNLPLFSAPALPRPEIAPFIDGLRHAWKNVVAPVGCRGDFVLGCRQARICTMTVGKTRWALVFSHHMRKNSQTTKNKKCKDLKAAIIDETQYETLWKSRNKYQNLKGWQKACESKLFHSEWRLYRKPFIGVVLRMSQVDDFEVMKRHMRGGISWNPEILFRFIGILMVFYNPYNKRYCICILCFTKNIFFLANKPRTTSEKLSPDS